MDIDAVMRRLGSPADTTSIDGKKSVAFAADAIRELKSEAVRRR